MRNYRTGSILTIFHNHRHTARLRFFSLQDNMITPPAREVCVSCIGVNCMSECRPVSGNNPFRINNIANGTNYTVSLSLSSVFGQSEEGAPELYGESK